ncbi:MAG: heme ABC exporter ATP-binding protein CcmA, partial [Candidatus Thiodiazotropha sp.]
MTPETTAVPPPKTGLFEARSLSCIRDDRLLFESLDFGINPGQALVLEGRNGSGKTSLLRILSGIRLPESGQVLWDGKDIFRLGPEFHEHIAYLGHKDGSKLDLTPLENLRIARGLGKAREDISLEEALDQVGLFGFEDVPTRNMSAGQQRRLAIARLLVTDARLWIL